MNNNNTSGIVRDPPAPSSEVETTTPVRANILMVDDQPARLLTYESILNGLGVRCVKALSCDEALARLLQDEFAVILLDVHMPGMDGFELARLIREHPRLERTPIIFVTGVHVSELDQLKGYEVGAIDYLSVPVVPEILRSKVAVLIELHARRKELHQPDHQRKLRAVLEHPHLATVLCKAERDKSGAVTDLVYLAANANVHKVMGLDRQLIIGKRLSEVMPERLHSALPICTQVIESGAPASYEARIGTLDMSVSVYAVGNDEIVISAVDITERRTSQEGLLLAKRAAQLGTYDWDIQSDTLVWDERTHELWGIPPAGPTKVATFFSQVHPDDHAATRRAIDRSFDPKGDRIYSALYRVINRVDGITRWIEATGRVYFEGDRPARMVGVVQEVSDRVLAQQKLAESEQRFRELANTIDQFAWTCDELGNASWYNDRWYEYTGTSREEMAGDGWVRVHHPHHLPRVIAHLQSCLRSGRPYEDTFPLRGKDGGYRWFLTRAVPIRDETGRVMRWFGTNTDVTELRNLQDALQAADRRKDEFLAMLAHELRNPVAPISNAAEVLARLIGEDKRCRPLVDMIHRQTGHLARLLDDLLDVARVTQGHIELRREVLTVASCIDQALESVQPLIREKAQRVTLTQTPAPLCVQADKVRLTQSIANVLVNAAKYTDSGGEIRIRPYADGDDAVIEISDTGAGIAPEFLPRVFDLFAQSERALDRSQGGLGIGLAVCKQLIEMHGGTVAAASAGLGHGATFTIRLPLAEAPSDSASAVAASTLVRRRILIVDDNRDAADSLAILLQMAGHETCTAYSAEMALEVLPTFDAEVVVLDIGLPGMDGYQLARQLRAGSKPMRLIALSGYGQIEDKQRSAEAGFDAHLVKPVEFAALSYAISA